MSSEVLVGRFSIGDLIKAGVISAHKDGNFGSLYPRIDDFVDDGVPLLTAKVVTAGRIDFDAAQKLRRDKAAKLTYGFIQAGDVLLSHNATVGRVAVVPEFNGQAMIGTSLTYFRLDSSRLLPRYLACFFESRDFQNQLSSVMGLSTRNQVPITAQRLLEVEVLDVEVQRQLSEFVGAIDDRITLLRETNATLEAIAQALFKSWFVDFDPVRAKAEGLEPQAMAPITAALFPDSFEESVLGLVPRGWRVGKVEDVMDLPYGKALKSTDRVVGVVPVYGSGGITGYHNESLVDGPSIIVGRKGTVGSLYWEDRPFFPIDTVFYVKAKQPLTYCYYLLQTLGLEGMNTDGAVPGLNRNNAYRLQVTVPSAPALQAFDEIVAVVREKIFANSQQVETLTQLRGILLPRLISGQLSLPEAEQAVEEVLA